MSKKNKEDLSSLRKELLHCDKKLIKVLNKRFSITQKIGELKRKQKIEVVQNDFWNNCVMKRQKWADKEKVNKTLVEAIFDQIHHYSLQQQKAKTKKGSKR